MGDKNITFVDRGNVKGSRVNVVETPMHNNCDATYESVRKNINLSNRIACNNFNKYPIQEQASLLEIWEQVPREEGHVLPVEHTDYVYVLRSGLEFEDVRNAYLRMFVNRRFHRSLIKLLEQDLEHWPQLPPRIKGAYKWLRYLKEHWECLYNIARKWRRSLFYEDFVPPEIHESEKWNFSIHNSVYRAKMWAILFPDICVPYDSRSRNRIIQCIGRGRNITYVEMLEALRSLAINLIIREESNVAEFRRLDQPGLVCPYNSVLIALRRLGFNYGTDYTPEERPISRVIDKYFYNPGFNQAQLEMAEAPVIVPVRGPKSPKTLQGGAQMELFEGNTKPLSGRGKPIHWKETEDQDGLEITWGKTIFNMTNEQIDLILDTFFKDDEWYPLGASMTNPTPGGLGEFLKNNLKSLTPRHASALAAVLTSMGEIESEGKRPIYLRIIRNE